MRLLQRVITVQPNLDTLLIDTSAIGARGAHIMLQPAGAGIVDQFTVDDVHIRDNGTQVRNRIAIWFYDGVDSSQGSYIAVPVYGDRLQLANNSGGSIESFVRLYDEPILPATGSYPRFLRASTLAALGVFTSPDMAVGKFVPGILALQTDRAADVFVDVKTTAAAVYIPWQTANIPGAGGGVAALQLFFPCPVFRIRVRNNDAALLMTYNASVYVAPAAA